MASGAAKNNQQSINEKRQWRIVGKKKREAAIVSSK